jgi:hypothetical protein
MKGDTSGTHFAPDNNEIDSGIGKAHPDARNTNEMTRFSLGLSHDPEKGEVQILDRRFAVVDIAAFCQRWDTLVGRKVAGVQMKNLEYHLGVDDAKAIMRNRPDATVEQLITYLQETDRISGVGVTKVTRTGDELFHIEIKNPVVAGTEGAAAFFASGWWCGAIDTVLKRRFDVGDPIYDREKNVLKFDLKARPVQEKD